MNIFYVVYMNLLKGLLTLYICLYGYPYEQSLLTRVNSRGSEFLLNFIENEMNFNFQGSMKFFFLCLHLEACRYVRSLVYK